MQRGEDTAWEQCSFQEIFFFWADGDCGIGGHEAAEATSVRAVHRKRFKKDLFRSLRRGCDKVTSG